MPQDRFVEGFRESHLELEREEDEDEDDVESEKCKVLADDSE